MRVRFQLIVFGILFTLYLFASSTVRAQDQGTGDVQESLSQNGAAVRKLDFFLKEEEDQARVRRKWGGGFLMGLGAVSLVGGVSTALSGVPSEVPISLGITGVVLGGLGTLIRLSPTDREVFPVKFHQMPEGTPEQIHEKRMLGESYLTIFGHQAKRNRLMGSTVNIILGTALIGWYASENQGSYRYVNSFLLIEGAVIGSLGLVNLFVESDSEKALKSYDEFTTGSKNLLARVNIGFAPIPSGAVANFSVAF